MVKRNPHFAKLASGYLFPEINKRKKAFLEKNPNAKLISLGIGDTTEPIPPSIVKGLVEESQALGTVEGYTGYGLEQGLYSLRQKIAEVIYHKHISAEEIFISDGAKCDIGRLQIMFGSKARMAVQDPSYPVYVDTSVMMGQTSNYQFFSKHYEGIIYMPCLPENLFFPTLETIPIPDIIYFCSPNNPTGATASKEQLTKLVEYAKTNRAILIFDAAYAMYIQDPEIPKSIYEIPGADEVAIELGSFSKMAGFTGVRLGWTVVPEKILFDDGELVKNDWGRLHSTFFNGASNIAQRGGLAALQAEGFEEMKQLITYYMENTRIIRKALEDSKFIFYGGMHAPFLWVKFPLNSWDAFEMVLNKAQLVTTPGLGFGPAGEGFLRLSALGHRENIEEAASRLRKLSK